VILDQPGNGAQHAVRIFYSFEKAAAGALGHIEYVHPEYGRRGGCRHQLLLIVCGLFSDISSPCESKTSHAFCFLK
jgi:hypothetical protein